MILSVFSETVEDADLAVAEPESDLAGAGLLAAEEDVLADEDLEEEVLEEDVLDELFFADEPEDPDLEMLVGDPILDEDLAGAFLTGVSTEDISTVRTRVEPVRMLGATLSERWLAEAVPEDDLVEPDPPLTEEFIFLTLVFLESFSISISRFQIII